MQRMPRPETYPRVRGIQGLHQHALEGDQPVHVGERRVPRRLRGARLAVGAQAAVPDLRGVVHHAALAQRPAGPAVARGGWGGDGDAVGAEIVLNLITRGAPFGVSRLWAGAAVDGRGCGRGHREGGAFRGHTCGGRWEGRSGGLDSARAPRWLHPLTLAPNICAPGPRLLCAAVQDRGNMPPSCHRTPRVCVQCGEERWAAPVVECCCQVRVRAKLPFHLMMGCWTPEFPSPPRNTGEGRRSWTLHAVPTGKHTGLPTWHWQCMYATAEPRCAAVYTAINNHSVVPSSCPTRGCAPSRLLRIDMWGG